MLIVLGGEGNSFNVKKVDYENETVFEVDNLSFDEAIKEIKGE